MPFLPTTRAEISSLRSTAFRYRWPVAPLGFRVRLPTRARRLIKTALLYLAVALALGVLRAGQAAGMLPFGPFRIIPFFPCRPLYRCVRKFLNDDCSPSPGTQAVPGYFFFGADGGRHELLFVSGGDRRPDSPEPGTKWTFRARRKLVVLRELMHASVDLVSSATRRERLQAIQRRGSLSVTEAMEGLDMARPPVREHLLPLKDKGLLHRTEEREGRGRPSHRYEMTRRAKVLFSSRDGELMGTLVGSCGPLSSARPLTSG